MANDLTEDDLKQKVNKLEEELIKSKQAEEALRVSQKEELCASRVEKSAVSRIHKSFVIFGIIISLFLTVIAIAGVFVFGKYIEKSVADSISHDVNEKVRLQFNEVEQSLKDIEDKVEEAWKRAEKTKLETDARLENTVDQVKQIGRLMVGDVDSHRRETLSELRKESKKFAEERKKTREESNRIFNEIRVELAKLEKLTTVVRAPLRKKIAILKTLKLDRSSADADIQRYIAILVLKEMEDAELVNRENVREEARQVI